MAARQLQSFRAERRTRKQEARRTISGWSVSSWPGARRQPARCVLVMRGKQERHSVEMGKQVQRLHGC